MGCAGLAHLTRLPGGHESRLVGGWGARAYFCQSWDVRVAVNNGIFLDTGVLSSSGPSDLTLFPKDSCGASCIEYDFVTF